MSFFDNLKKRDKKLGDKFLRRFPNIIIGKDKESGKFFLLFKSKTDVILQIGTDQVEPQELPKKEQ